jgi:hypothetical protein
VSRRVSIFTRPEYQNIFQRRVKSISMKRMRVLIRKPQDNK